MIYIARFLSTAQRSTCLGAQYDKTGCNVNMADKLRNPDLDSNDKTACDIFDEKRGWYPAITRTGTEYLSFYQNATTGCSRTRISSKCKIGYEGPLCAVCQNGFTRIRGDCRKCYNTALQASLIIIIGVISIIVLVWVRRQLKKIGAEARNTKKDITRIFIICLNLAQIQNSVKSVMSGIEFPDTVLKFFAMFNWVDLDIASLTGATCNSAVDFRARLGFMSILPILVVILAFILYKRGQNNIAKKVLAHHDLSHEERALDYKKCHMELFDMVDVDHSGSLDAGEVADLTKVVGLNTPEHPVTDEMSLRLIQSLCKSSYATTMNREVYMHCVLTGEMTKQLEGLFEKKKTSGKKSKKSKWRKLKVASKFGNGKPYVGKGNQNKDSDKHVIKRRTSTMLHNDDDAHDVLVAWNNRRKLVAASWSWPAQVLMLLHTPISRKVFHYFDSDDIGVGPTCNPKEGCTNYRGFLRADYRIQVSEGGVYTDEYQQFLIVVMIVLICYTIALPVGMGGFIFTHRKSLYDPKVQQSFGWLYSRLTRNAEFWEVHEMFRKMTLTGIMVFAPRNTAIRAAMCLMVCIIAQINLNYFRPYRSTLVFWVEQAAYSMALLVYICSMLFQNNMDADQQALLAWVFVFMNCLFWTFAMIAVVVKLYRLRARIKHPVGVSKKQQALDDKAMFKEIHHNKASRMAPRGNVKAMMALQHAAHVALHFDRGMKNMKAHEISTIEKVKRLEKNKIKSKTRLDKRRMERKKNDQDSSIASWDRNMKTKVVPIATKEDTDEESKESKTMIETKENKSETKIASNESNESNEKKTPEMEALCKQLRDKIKTSKTLQQIFNKIDQDSNSMLCKEEFCKLRVLIKPKPSKKIMKQLWDDVTAHNNSTKEIKIEELKTYLKITE